MKRRTLIVALASAALVIACQGDGSSVGGSSFNQTVATQATTTTSLVTPDGTWTGAYFTNWNVWRNSAVSGEGAGKVKHLDIFDKKAPSFISYSFFAPKVSTDNAGTVGYGGGAIGTGWASQANGTIGDPDNAYENTVAAANYAELSKFKQQNSSTLIIASIGGWSYTSRWSQFAKDANYDVNSPTAQAFLNSCEQLLRGSLSLSGGAAYPQFDGINIDWEFPGYGHGGPQAALSQEPAFFEALMLQLRTRVDKVKTDTGQTKVLTVALPIVPAKMTGNSAIKWSDLANTFDWIDLMAFDAHGEFDAADSNSMTAQDQAPAGEVSTAIQYLLDSGVDSRRIILGAPTYTRQMLVKTQPSAANNYDYGLKGDMDPAALGLSIYHPMLFTDAPNAEDYYPAGGMVDNTGVYSYNCMLQKQNLLSANYCPAPATLPSKTDNRGLFGQPLPTTMSFTEIPGASTDLGVGHAWAYDNAYNVVKSPAAGNAVAVSNVKYNAYSVFSYDTPSIITQKIDKIILPYKLGGMWFWDIHNDAYKTADASRSLYMTAVNKLGTNTGGVTPTPTPSVTPTSSPEPLPISSFYKPDGSWTGAYFTNWNQWRNSAVSGEGNGSTKHLDIFDQKAPSFISYAFFGPKLSTDTASTVGYGGGAIGSGWASQANGTVGDLDNAYEADKAKANYAELKKFKAKNSGTLLIASIGGWSYTARWSQFAKDANYNVNSTAAQAFLDSCEKLLRGTLTLPGGSTYPVFDGINIDWEYPGYGHQGKPQSQFAQEPAFFEALAKALRVRIDKIKTETGYTKVLSVALPIVPAKMTGNNAIKWSNLANTFDWIDLMAFDAHGEFDAADSSLMTPMDQAPAGEVVSAVNYLLDSGVEPNRIVLGLPTYTRQMLTSNKPSAANNYGYGDKGSMDPAVIGLPVYKPMLFTDAPNAEDYYPAGGMVDNTGVYSYNCMLQKQNQLSANYCPAPASLPNATDNRGLFGQPLPTNVYFTTIAGSAADLYIDHAWAYDDAYSVVQSPAAGNAASIPNVKYNAYSVFSYDTPSTVEQKVNKLVKPYHLGGVWYWDVHNDAYKSADAGKSLYIAATTVLGTNTQPNGNIDLGPCGGVEAWSSTATYTTGMQVYENNVIYQAKWWNQNTEPASHSGTSQEWSLVGNCPTTPAPTPTPSVTPSPTPSPVPTGSPSPTPVPSPTPSVVPSPTPSPVPTISPSPTPTQSPTPAPAKTGTVTITMPTVVSAYNGNLQVQLLNAKDSNAVVATYTIKQGSSVTSGDLPISDTTHGYKVKLLSGIADPISGVTYVESGTPGVAVKKGQNTAMSIPMKTTTTTKRTVTLAISGLQGSDRATVSFRDANGKYNYAAYAGYGNGNAVFKIENNQNLTISVAASGSGYQSSSLVNSSIISKNQTIAMTFSANVQPSPAPSPVPSVVPSPIPSPIPSPVPSVVPSPVPSPIASPTPQPSPSPAAYQTYPAGVGSYVAGSKVYGSDGNLYECKGWPYTSWCNGSSTYYAPGSGLAWDQAWTLIK